MVLVSIGNISVSVSVLYPKIIYDLDIVCIYNNSDTQIVAINVYDILIAAINVYNMLIKVIIMSMIC